MRIILQRVSEARVQVAAETVGAIERGVLLLVGIARGDTSADVAALARKVAGLRIFPGRTPMDRTLADVGGACLVVSQFTLAATLRKGNRPGFDAAEEPARAEALCLALEAALRATGLPVASGRFGADMAVTLTNDGPVTFVLEASAGRIQ